MGDEYSEIKSNFTGKKIKKWEILSKSILTCVLFDVFITVIVGQLHKLVTFLVNRVEGGEGLGFYFTFSVYISIFNCINLKASQKYVFINKV